MDNRPVSRKRNETGAGSGLYRRGSGLGGGRVGSGGRPSGGSGPVRGGNGGSIIGIIIGLIIVVLGGGGGLSALTGSGGSSDLLSSGLSSFSNTSTGSWKENLSNLRTLNESVAEGSRAKYTTIKGNNTDKVTVMLYMCGTDLESKHGMASNDLREIANADISDNMNFIVYTGGCSGWKTSGISSKTNQIFKIKGGSLQTLSANEGNKSMTDPATLSGFIKYATQKFPADRYELILWDHGGGSVSGFGYDQNFAKSGSMSLEGIDTALSNAGIKFDFIGFDACLMATAENALMLSKYGDYLIASEETEPGVGWYYTDWVSELSKNTSKPTLQVGKQICDDFVSFCSQKCRGQKTTLSVVDLAELQHTLPSALKDFSQSTAQLIKNKEYKKVSTARSDCREFSPSTRIDQVDLADLADNIGTQESKQLVNTVLSAVKYNNTSSNMANACGLSIYFPYRSASKIDKAVKTFKKIGMDEEYSKCISDFAKLEVGGQVSYGASSPLNSLLGQSPSPSPSQSDITQLLQGLSNGGSVDGFDLSSLSFLTGRSLSDEETANYIASNSISDNELVWKDGRKIVLSEEQWSIVQTADKSMYVDDGSGYIDLGLDNIFSFDEEGNFIGDGEKKWLAVNGQVVAYYHTDTTTSADGSVVITGYIPALLNGEKVKLITVFEGEDMKGYIAGVQRDYDQSLETQTIGKNIDEVVKGDTIDFICDYYSYEGEYIDNFKLGETLTVGDELILSDVTVGDADINIMYVFTDIYNNKHYTPVM